MLLANVVHYFDEPTNIHLMRTAARAIRDNGIVVVIDAVRPRSVERLAQVEGLLDLFFGAVSGFASALARIDPVLLSNTDPDSEHDL